MNPYFSLDLLQDGLRARRGGLHCVLREGPHGSLFGLKWRPRSRASGTTSLGRCTLDERREEHRGAQRASIRVRT